MSKKEEVEARAEKILLPLLAEHDFELVDVEYAVRGGNRSLCAYIDKKGGITIDDCELINRAWGDIMDREDFIPDSYLLEVSSPGLGRKLKKEKDFARSIGESVDVSFYRARKIPKDKGKEMISVKEVTGILKAFTKDSVTLETSFEKDYEISRADISVIKLSIDF